MAAAAVAAALKLSPSLNAKHYLPLSSPPSLFCHYSPFTASPSLSSRRNFVYKATDISPATEPSASGGGGDGRNWIPVIPLSALPKGERRVIIQKGEMILLLWYKDEVLAIENRSPVEGAYSEGLLNAKITK